MGELLSRNWTLPLVLLALALLPACQGGSSSGRDDDDATTDADSDTDVDSDADGDGDVDTGPLYDGECDWGKLPVDVLVWDFYEACVPLDDAECVAAVSEIIGEFHDFEDVCEQWTDGIIGCDLEIECRLFIDVPSANTLEVLCALSLLECIDAIGGGFYE